jgi:hypothetical protein
LRIIGQWGEERRLETESDLAIPPEATCNHVRERSDVVALAPLPTDKGRPPELLPGD